MDTSLNVITPGDVTARGGTAKPNIPPVRSRVVPDYNAEATRYDASRGGEPRADAAAKAIASLLPSTATLLVEEHNLALESRTTFEGVGQGRSPSRICGSSVPAAGFPLRPGPPPYRSHLHARLTDEAIALTLASAVAGFWNHNLHRGALLRLGDLPSRVAERLPPSTYTSRSTVAAR